MVLAGALPDRLLLLRRSPDSSKWEVTPRVCQLGPSILAGLVAMALASWAPEVAVVSLRRRIKGLVAALDLGGVGERELTGLVEAG